MAKQRLDQVLVLRGLATSRSQAESLIRMGQVQVNGQVATKTGQMLTGHEKLRVTIDEHYVSRAAYKLGSVAETLHISFSGVIMLDVGSSTGGFTDYALQHGAKFVVAVDVGTEQLHPSLRVNPNIELHEKTDIRSFETKHQFDLVVIDVSFISLKEILPSVAKLATKKSQIVAMVKPQFEAGKGQTNGGIIKNERMRRDILKEFEQWASQQFIIKAKADSAVAGSKGNLERFYLLQKSA